MTNLGFVRVAAGTPMIKVANTKHNQCEIIKLMELAEAKGTGILLLPELTLTGCTAGDLFFQDTLYKGQLESLAHILEASKTQKLTTVLGLYLKIKNKLCNCAVVIQQGAIAGAVPQMFTPNSKEYADSRWFLSGQTLMNTCDFVNILGEEIPFGNLLFTDFNSGLRFGLEIGQDMASLLAPDAHLAMNGAHIILVPAACGEIVGRNNYIRDLLRVQSAKNACAYVYASAGVSESTTDMVFSGQHIVTENGVLLAEGGRFERESNMTITEIDFGRLNFVRNNYSCEYSPYCSEFGAPMDIDISPVRTVGAEETLLRTFEKNPFVPEDTCERNRRCKDIFDIQCAALAKRLEHTRISKSVIGISGGLDSTLAVLVAAQTHKLLGRPATDVVAITMPGFGTTDKTYNNALTIMKLLGTDLREISIKDSVLCHFKDIGHKEDVHDLTYENAQARERTQILMDIAGMENGLVVGTGDLSEAALGWCTYNGDHMAMYNVNAGIPKTLVRFVVKWFIENKLSPQNAEVFSADDALLAKTLQDVLDTPISPELIPPSADGKMTQKTEDSVGPYALHDFFIYYTLNWGAEPQKLLYIAKQVFEGEYSEEEIKKWLKLFYRRFFTQQFKRSCSPDGPKVGTVSLSPRGDLKMPSDADFSLWLEEL